MSEKLKQCPFCKGVYQKMKESVGKMVERPDNAIRMIRESIESSMFDGYYGSEWSEYEDGLLTYIASLEAENARLKEAQRWVPVSERMPDDWESVLAIDISKSTQDVVLAFYNPEISLWSTHFSFDLWVTHWMPLPEPPEVQE